MREDRVTKINSDNNSEKIKDNRDKKNLIIKKLIILALLFAVLGFLYVQRDALRESVRLYVDPDYETAEVSSVSMLGSRTVEQDVTMQSEIIRTVGIMFSNPSSGSATGRVTVALIDKDGNKVAETGLDAANVIAGDITKFLLSGDSEGLNTNRIVTTNDTNVMAGYTEVVKGATYTVRITTEDVKSEGAFDLMLNECGDNEDIPVVRIDGEDAEGECAYLYVANRMYNEKTNKLFLVLILMTFIFILIPFEVIDEWIEKKTGKSYLRLSPWVLRMMFLLTPFVTYFIIQKYVSFGLGNYVNQLFSERNTGILNLIIIGLIWWAIYTISTSTRISSILTALIGSAFGFANYALLLFRDSPLVATDFSQFGTAMQVVKSYVLTLDMNFMWSFLLTTLWCIACLVPAGVSREKEKGLMPALKRRIVPVIVLAIWGGVFYYTFFASTYIEDHEFRVSSFKPRGSYTRNGCALSFVISWRNAVIKKPDGYDIAEIEAIADKYPSDKLDQAKGVNTKTPNVIVVMNESFTDFDKLGEFETNQDYMPFYRSLEGNNVIKGTMHSSVFGGSTANSEFEGLTGFSMDFLPYMSVPYRSVIKEETPSLASYMKSRGYGGNITFHPGMANSYNRDVVYPLLGFDTHVSFDDLEDPELLRDYVSDEYDYRYVEEEYEKFRAEDPKDPFWMFNVTIQNHAGYMYSAGIVDAGIEIESQEAAEEQAIQFLNLMKKSDEALEQLITYFSNVDEDTVIVLYGDHQPRVGSQFYEALLSPHEGLSELEWSEMKHEVPILIWANFDLKGNDSDGADTADDAEGQKTGTEAEDAEKAEAQAGETGSGENAASEDLHHEEDDFVLSANYIAPYLKQTIGMPLTGWDKYLLDLYKELPVVNAICCIDAKGNIYDASEPTPYDDKLNEYRRLQYNGLIDYKNRVNKLFELQK
ncbi:MAG: LTA synthase family protein [Clostridiales bacterium]|nr:LTA synthase family protein [Clostridiales bacterium]